MAWAKRHLGRGGRVVVMTGDGELQEGQNYEALQAAAHERLGKLSVVVDRNELQSDKPTDEIVALGDLEAKLRAFGWHVAACDGHDHAALRAGVRRRSARRATRPQGARRAHDQGQGRLVHGAPGGAREGGGTYRWHAGAPDDESFARAFAELVDADRRAALGARPRAARLEPVEQLEPSRRPVSTGEPESGAGARAGRSVTDEYVVDAYGEALLDLAEREPRPRRARRRPRLRLPRARLRARVPRAIHRVRHRRAGHGLGSRRACPSRPAPRRQLVRVLPRLTRERADLQPGE